MRLQEQESVMVIHRMLIDPAKRREMEAGARHALKYALLTRRFSADSRRYAHAWIAMIRLVGLYDRGKGLET